VLRSLVIPASAGGEGALPSSTSRSSTTGRTERVMFAGLLMMGTLIEWLVWGVICAGLLIGLVLRIGEAMHHAISWLWHHPSQGHLTHPRIATFLLAGALAGAMLPIPTGAAAQGPS